MENRLQEIVQKLIDDSWEIHEVPSGFSSHNACSVSDLCSKVGISRQAYYNIANGVSSPTVLVALKIVKYINDNGRNNYTIEDIWKL